MTNVCNSFFPLQFNEELQVISQGFEAICAEFIDFREEIKNDTDLNAVAAIMEIRNSAEACRDDIIALMTPDENDPMHEFDSEEPLLNKYKASLDMCLLMLNALLAQPFTKIYLLSCAEIMVVALEASMEAV